MRAVTTGLVAMVVGACGGGPTPTAGGAAPSETRVKVEAAKAELAKPEAVSEAKAKRQHARKIQYSDPTAAYDEAKASYEAEPHVDSLWIMGSSACRLRDAERVRFPLSRLDGELRAELVDYCARKGVDVDPPKAE